MELYMRHCTQYSSEFKENLLSKALAPNAPRIVELARESGIPYPTLYQWVCMSRKKKIKSGSNTTQMRPKDQSAETKLQAVLDTINMTEEEKGAYCRQHGFYTHHLAEWKKQMLVGLGASNSLKETKSDHHKTSVEIKKLKSDLHRKDKALAEVSALLILKKKADLLWGDKEDD
jgi:transposase